MVQVRAPGSGVPDRADHSDHRGRGHRDRLPVVPLGQLHIGLRHHVRRQVGAVRGHGHFHDGRRRHQHQDRLPAQAAAPAGVTGAAGPGGVPGGDRAAPPAGAHRGPRADRPHRRPHRRGQLAYLAAVRQRGLVRDQRPAVQARHLVLRVRLPVHPDDAQLPLRGRPALAGGGRRRALPVRRAAAAGARPAGDARGPGPPVRPRGHLRAAQGRRVLGGPVRHRLLAARGGADRRVLHRRERRASGQDRTRGDRGDLRRAVLRRRDPPERDAARRRVRPAGAVGRHHRRRLPGHRAAVRGQAQRARQGEAVPAPRDPRHPQRVRGLRGQGHRLPGGVA